jgi:hypothetical protein
MGHDGNSHIHADVSHLLSYECFVPIQHPDGGYHLLSPLNDDKLRLVVVAEDGTKLEVREHGTTLWEFKKVAL